MAIGEPLQGYSDSVLSVAFSPDTKHIVSSSHDKTIQVWDTASDTTQITGFSDNSVLCADGWMTTPDGQLLFWVPLSNRVGFLWPRNTIVIGAQPTQLDCCQLTPDFKWADCQKYL
jgi:WD40 repeat protein